MSKYQGLWSYVGSCGEEDITLSFEEIERLAGVGVDHSFLRYKRELAEYGYKVGKISMKARTVLFIKTGR